MKPDEFAEHIRGEMERREMSLSDLSRASGLSKASISEFLNLRRPAGARLVVGLAHGLGIDADDLLAMAGLPTAHRPAAPGASELTNLFAQLDDDAQGDLLAIARAFVARRLSRGTNRHAKTPAAPD